MLSNYPPGVSGNEPAIAGPVFEREGTREVQHETCGYDGEALGGYSGDRYLVNFYADCPRCGEEIELIDLDAGDEFGRDWD